MYCLVLRVARARKPRLVALLIKRGANVASAPGGGLFAAGWWEDLKILALLIRAGAAVDIVVGDTPEKEFGPALLKWLVKQGASPDIPDMQGITPRARAQRKRDKRFLAALA